MNATTVEVPRVWVGCLACYNAGTLRGEWVDADEAGGFVPCEGRGHEEWWCMDHEGFGGLLDGECSPMAAQELAELIAEVEADGGPMAAFVAYRSNVGAEYATVEGFRDVYRGEWSSVEDYAQELAEDCGMVPDDLAWPLSCIDWKRAARELTIGGDIWTAESDGGVFVFGSE